MFITPTAQHSEAERERQSQWDTHMANACPKQVIQNPTGNSCSEKYRRITNQRVTCISCHLHVFVEVAVLS